MIKISSNVEIGVESVGDGARFTRQHVCPMCKSVKNKTHYLLLDSEVTPDFLNNQEDKIIYKSIDSYRICFDCSFMQWLSNLWTSAEYPFPLVRT